jgi:hypothetical protein
MKVMTVSPVSQVSGFSMPSIGEGNKKAPPKWKGLFLLFSLVH